MATIRELVTVLKYKLDKSGLSQYGKAAVDAGKKVEQAGRNATRPWKEGIDKANNSTKRLVATAGKLLGVYIGLRSIPAVLRVAGEMGQLNAQLRATIPNAEQFAGAQKQLLQISNEFVRPLAENIKDFAQFRQTMANTGTTVNQQLMAYRALQASMTASGTSASRSAQLMRRFSRGMAQGALGASTIQTFIDGNVVGLHALVKGLNEVAPQLHVTTENIRDLATKGQLTSDIVLPALTSQMVDLSKAAGRVPVTLSEAMRRLRNSFTFMVSESKQVNGALGIVVRGINFLADHIEGITKIGLAFAGLWATSTFISSIGGIVGGFQKVWKVLRLLIGLGAVFWGWIAVIAAIVASVVLLFQDWWTWLHGGDSLLGDWYEKIRDISKAALALAKAFTDKLAGGMYAVRDAIGAAAEALADKLGAAVNWVMGLVDDLLGRIKGIVGALGSVKDKVAGAGQALSSGAGQIWDKATGWIPGVGGSSKSETNITDSRQQVINITGVDTNNAQFVGQTVGRYMSRMPAAEAAP